MRLYGMILMLGMVVAPALADDARIERALQLIQSVPFGQNLITAAETQIKKPLRSVLVADRLSHTDAVLSRVFDSETHSEKKERKVVIHLNVAQDPVLLSLDLAHELAHASAVPTWDPYDPELSLIRYIQLAIEGEGGEASAVHTECRLALELEKSIEIPSHRCDRYIRRMANRELDGAMIKEDFYRIGESFQIFQEILGNSMNQFPFLSPKRPVFISSTGNAPYPVALAKEYLGLTESACKNTLRRIQTRQTIEPREKDLIERRCRSIAAPVAFE